MSTWPSVGMKCVYVGPYQGGMDEWGESAHKHGSVYTVRAIHPDGEVIRTVEVVNPIRKHVIPDGRTVMCEVWTYLSSFRPIVTKTAEEDSAMFRSLIDDIPYSITERLDMIREMLG